MLALHSFRRHNRGADVQAVGRSSPPELPGRYAAGIFTPYFNPHGVPPTPCRYCVPFGGLLYGGSAARCDRAGGSPVQASPATGCAFYVREVGSDDDAPAVPARPAELPFSILRAT